MLLIRSAIFFLVAGIFPLAAQLSGFEFQSDHGEPPITRVDDRDHYYRTKPEKLQRISDDLIRLKAEYDFEVYLIILSGHVGEDLMTMAQGYHEAWLDEKNDGLIFLIDVQSRAGNVGYSEKLYGGGFMKEDILPRIMRSDLETIMLEASECMVGVEDPHQRVENFAVEITKLISENLEARKQLNEGAENVRLMGVMAVGILLVGFIIALVSKLLARSEKRVGKVYRFPDVLVGERLKAQNGGGKISWTSFDSPSER